MCKFTSVNLRKIGPITLCGQEMGVSESSHLAINGQTMERAQQEGGGNSRKVPRGKVIIV
jgi:hypothetical protein